MAPRTPLLRPDRFFTEREFHLLRLLTVVILLTFSVPVAVSGLGWIVTERVDGTVVVDNPNRPSAAFCENAPESMAGGCDAPERVERDVDVVIERAVEDLRQATILALPLTWLLFGGLLHAGSWLLDGDGGAVESFAVALWGMVPSVFALLALLMIVAVSFEPVTVTPDSGSGAFGELLRTSLRPAMRIAPLVSAVTALWSGVIWRFGLIHERGLSRGEATALAGGVAVLSFLVTLV